MIDLPQHIATFGPAAILVGSAVEGQTTVVAAGVMARHDLLPLWLALGAAALGSALIDHLLFVLGRSVRDSRFVRRAANKPAFDKALRLIERHPTGFIMAFRFIYGLRAAGPVAVGVSEVPHLRFAILNAMAAVLWAAVFLALGYAFGPMLIHLLGRMAEHKLLTAAVAAGVALLGLGIWRWRGWIGRATTF